MIVLLHSFKNIFFVPELRRKLAFTLGVFAVLRFGAQVPVPGVDITALHALLHQSGGVGLWAYLDMFSGGALSNFAIFTLGMSPYITASIMMQILSGASESLKALSKEGEYGRRVINQYTRYLALVISVMQSIGFISYMERYPGIVISPGWGFRLMAMLIMCVGSMFVMWLGEQINAHGIGNGSSAVIFAGIVAGLPAALFTIAEHIKLGQSDFLVTGLLLFVTLLITMCVIFLEKGERKIPVQYAKRVVGNKVYGGQTSYIPFKINPANVVPVIFSGAFLQFPAMIGSLLSVKWPFINVFIASWFYENKFLFNTCNAALIIFFTFVYTSMIFDSAELADNIRKSGGFIPGIRPGVKTVEFFDYLLTRLGFTGAVYLAILAILPGILKSLISFPVMVSGTGLLIVIGVALDTSAQIESHLIEQRYDGFLSNGVKLKGRALRY